MNLIEHLSQRLQEYPFNRPVYIACSGGRDSLALSFACVQLYKKGQLPKPTLIHVNHHLQSMADDWARQVQNFATEQGVDYQVCHVYLSNGSEQSARDARRQVFFERVADGGVLLLAHHEDDQAETMLMRLLSGTSLQGLCAMRVWQSQSDGEKIIYFFRPWLDVPRLTISQFAIAHHLPFVDDPTNATGDNARSFIRREILPKLRHLNPQATTNMARTSLVLQQSQALISDTITDLLAKLSGRQAGADVLYLDKFNTLSHSQKTTLLHQFIKGGLPYGCDYQTLHQALALCKRTDNDHQTLIFWQARPHAIVLCRYDDVLYRYHDDLWQAFKQPSLATLNDGVAHIGLQQFSWQIYPAKTISKVDKDTPIPYRHKTLKGKKLYQTLRIPPWLRPHLWLVSGDEPVHHRLVSIELSFDIH